MRGCGCDGVRGCDGGGCEDGGECEDGVGRNTTLGGSLCNLGRLGHTTAENLRSPKLVEALAGKDIKMVRHMTCVLL